MAPIRDERKNREKNVDHCALLHSLPSPVRPPLDWWDNFSKRFSDAYLSLQFFFPKFLTLYYVFGYVTAVFGNVGLTENAFERPSHGQRNLAEFGSFFKFSRKTFDYICGLVEDEIISPSDLKGNVLSLNDCVDIALRRLSSGESLATIGNLVGVNQSAVGDITWSFVEAMEKKGHRYLHWPSTEEDTQMIKSQFERIRGLPNCCGAIDTTKIVFCPPCDDLSSKFWCDEEDNPCMMLQGIVDADMRFLYVSIGFPGCFSDTNVLYDSFFKVYQEENRLKGRKHAVAKEIELREYIVGDGEFPLLPWLITPFKGGEVLSVIQDDFNKRHYETWKVANQALTRLKETWKIIQGIVWRPDKDKLVRIAYVCCLLHNIMIDQNEVLQEEISPPSHHSPGSLQMNGELPDRSAWDQRDNLALYLAYNLPPC